MLVVTTDNLPPGYELVECHGILLCMQPVEVSRKNLIRAVLERDRNEWTDAMEGLIEMAKSRNRDTNVLYGLKISTSVGQFTNGTFLYLTITATAGRCVECARDDY